MGALAATGEGGALGTAGCALQLASSARGMRERRRRDMTVLGGGLHRTVAREARFGPCRVRSGKRSRFERTPERAREDRARGRSLATAHNTSRFLASRSVAQLGGLALEFQCPGSVADGAQRGGV